MGVTSEAASLSRTGAIGEVRAPDGGRRCVSLAAASPTDSGGGVDGERGSLATTSSLGHHTGAIREVGAPATGRR